jgi:hypothetical protein
VKAGRDIVRERGPRYGYIFATLYAVEGDWAYVKPKGHKHVERVSLRNVRSLKAREYGIR